MARILVVDDHATNRELITSLAAYRGHECMEAADGLEALTKVRTARPDLVICDILMPTMDGYEFVRQLRAEPAIAHTDVIFYTANFLEQEARTLAQSCGVTQILLKPCEPENVLQAIDLALCHAAPEPKAPPANAEQFDREHRRLLADKLVQKADQLDYANRRLSALTDLNLQLASERDPETLLEKVCRGARNLIGARYAILGANDASHAVLTRFATSGMNDADAGRVKLLRIDIGMLRQVMFDRAPRRFVNPSGNPLEVGLTADYPLVHSGLIVPIVSLKRAYGWIFLIDKLGSECFSEEDERLLMINAAQAGRIYENGSLYNQIKHSAAKLQVEVTERKQAAEKIRTLNLELEQRVRDLQHVTRALRTLSAGNRTMLRARSESELLNSFCKDIVSAGAYDSAIVWYHTDDAEHAIKAVAESGFGSGLESLQDLSSFWTDDEQGRDVVAKAVRSGQTHTINDLRSGQDHTHWLHNPDDCASAIACPLRIGERIIGALEIYHREPDAFQADEVQLLTESADDLAFGIAMLRAQAEQARTQAAMHRLTHFDALTDLPNEAQFNESLRAFIAKGQQTQRRFAVLQTNVDRLRDVNAALGLAHGDEMLREFSRRLLRVAPPDGLVARLRGNEFAILLPRADRTKAIEMVNVIEAELALPFLAAGIPLDMMARTGIVLFPNHGATAHDLFRRVDLAVQQARDRDLPHLVYDSTLDHGQSERLHMASALRRAIEDGDLRMHLQPKVEMATGRLCGAEALVRWQHAERGLLHPGVFISLAEQIGLIKPLTEWMLQSALQQNKAWLEQGCALPIAVNLSARNLRDEDLLRQIRQLHDSTGVPRGLLELEITESAVMEDAVFALRVLNQLKDEGIPLHIDDFGTGYSSLSYLQKLPVDCVKIDQSFVRQMVHDRDSAVIVKSTIDLIHDLGRKLIAEGVETAECWSQLQAFGCNVAQGYLIAKPMPPTEFQQWAASFCPPQSNS
ncbi:MAG: EAL domain-containing protein [Paucibacter sp.]|nr:EAL domain-containing protein [Roseateles sp.]